jgi:sulfur carrier protein ThiS
MSMLVTARLRPPDRLVEVADVRRVADLLARLEVLPGAVLVIRDGALLTSQDELHDGDKVEVRFAISGGSGGLMEPKAPEGPGEPRRGAPVSQAPGAQAPRWIGGS